MNPASTIIVSVFGGITVLVVVIVFLLPMLSELPIFASEADNLVSTANELGTALPVFGLILGVGVIGFILQQKR